MTLYLLRALKTIAKIRHVFAFYTTKTELYKMYRGVPIFMVIKTLHDNITLRANKYC